MIWWEKTVEYAFVRRFMPEINGEGDRFVTALDGNHEIIGDAFYSKDEKFILLEFKRDKASFTSELSKFIDYAEAKRQLFKRDSSHFLVYGVKAEAGFKLEACTYFSNNKKPIETIVDQGCECAVFERYISDFVSYKKNGGDGGLNVRVSPNPDPDPELRNGTFLDYFMVLGITNGMTSHVMTLSEFRTRGNPPKAPMQMNGPVTPPTPTGLERKISEPVKVLAEH